MKIEVSSAAPESVETDLLAVAYAGRPSPAIARLDARARGRLATVTGEARPDPGRTTLLHVAPGEDLRAARIVLVGVGRDGERDEDGLRTAAAAVVRIGNALGRRVAWAFDETLDLPPDLQVKAVVEGAVMGSYDPGRLKTGERPPRVETFVVAGVPSGLEETARRAEVVARWTNEARELVDGPPNEVTPVGVAEAAARLLAPLGVAVEVLDAAGIDREGLGGLATVGRGGANEPRLIVLRYGAGEPALGLVGKTVTFDSGGYFLKSQADIVKQKADMGGGAAVLATIGAIAELELPLSVLAVLPAAENMIDAAAFRPGDIVRTAAGLTVEVTNPDAEGRIILADGLWYARRQGARRLVDVATLTGAMRGALGDMYTGVFANDDEWRSLIVEAGNAAGDYAWPWPLHRRYARLLDSQVADIRNTSGRSFGYPIIAASFLERFVDGVPWAHLDIHSTAFLDEDRDYIARGASGAGVRLLVELVSRLSEGAGGS